MKWNKPQWCVYLQIEPAQVEGRFRFREESDWKINSKLMGGAQTAGKETLVTSSLLQTEEEISRTVPLFWQ